MEKSFDEKLDEVINNGAVDSLKLKRDHWLTITPVV